MEEPDPSTRAAPLPDHFGDYRVISLLGEGGMGAVYEAEQLHPRRLVALKVIRPGLASGELLRRFEHEAIVLARLQHPGIAQIHEAGTFDVPGGGGRKQPFFAMELVRGTPLTQYATENALSVRQRLELVVKICHAVQHAHQRGIVHRDLKPANILVDGTGQPKILDFGVARLTDSDVQTTTMHTDAGQIIGTLPYMSPEQAAGDPDELDTRSDVYAIGVICFELLAGRLPYDLRKQALHEAVRIIREEEPSRLSSVNRALRGDVETIVAKALEKEKERRYQSAGELGTDIELYLRDKAISARPASTWYRLSKFARRNKGLVTGLAAAFVLLAAGLVGTSLALQRALRAEAGLTTQLGKAEKIADFMSETLDGAGPSVALGRDITMLKEMMDGAAARIESGSLKSAPEAELRLRGTIGETYRQLALFPEATRMLEPAVALARSLYSEDHEDKALALRLSAALLKARGELPEAETLCREALEMSQRLSSGDDANVASLLLDLGSILRERGDLAGAETMFRGSLEMRRRIHPGDHADTSQSLNDLASLLQARGDLEGAMSLFRESIEMDKRLFQGDHPKLASSMGNLAALLHGRGDLAAAEPLYRESIESKKRLYSGDHPSVAVGLANLSDLVRMRGDLAQAESLCREALEMRRRLFPGDHPSVANNMSNLALLLQARGDLAGAEAQSLESLEMKKRLFPGDHPMVAVGLNSLGFLKRTRGDFDGAEAYSRESLEMTRRLFPGDHPDVAIGLHNMAHVYQGRGNWVEAEAHFREALDMNRRVFPGGHPNVATMMDSLASLHQLRGDAAAAEALALEALEMRRRILPPDHPSVTANLGVLANLLLERGDCAGAEPLAREAARIVERVNGKDEFATGDARLNLGRALAGLGRFAEAETEFVEGERVLATAKNVPAGRHERCIEALVTLYETWDEAAPGKGYDARAAEWKGKLPAAK